MFPMKEVFNEQFFTFFERICQPYFFRKYATFFSFSKEGTCNPMYCSLVKTNIFLFLRLTQDIYIKKQNSYILFFRKYSILFKVKFF